MKNKLLHILHKTAIFFGTGLIFGLFFFFILGAADEYTGTLFGFSTLIGLVLSGLFFLCLPLGNNIETAIEKRKDGRAQNALEEACAPFMPEGVFTIDGKRAYASAQMKMKFVIWHCRLFVYDDCFKLISAHGKKTEMLVIPFDEMIYARARKSYLSIQKDEGDGIYLSIEDEELRLLSELKKKNLPFLCEKMFLNYKERKGEQYFEFQYRRKDYEPNKEVQKNSLFLYWDDDELFRKIYEPHFNAMNNLTGNKEPFDFFSENAISKEQACVLREEILKHHPEEYEVFADWLEKAYTEFNGFYILGIY